MDPIISLKDITKTYRGVPAVKNVDFDLRRGEIHALLGENGAGKSTLTKIIAGAVDATSGTMFHHGKQVHYANPHEALDAGIAMVFQETSLVPSMTVDLAVSGFALQGYEERFLFLLLPGAASAGDWIVAASSPG